MPIRERSRTASAALTRRTLLAGNALAASGMLAGSGCATSQPTPRDSPDAPRTGLRPAQLTLWKFPHVTLEVESGLARQVVERFQTANPDVRVEYTPVTDRWQEKYTTAFASGTPPDVIYMTESLSTFARTKGLLALDQWLGRSKLKEDIHGELWPFSTIDTKVYGIPWLSNCALLFYNKELFRRAGLDPARPPGTWDDLVEHTRRLTASADGRWGYGIGPGEWLSNLYWVQQAGGDWFTSDLKRCALNTPEAVSGIQFLVDLVQKHRTAAIEGHTAGFQGETVAMLTSQPPFARRVLLARPDFPLGLAPRPRGPAPEPRGRAAYRGVGVLSVAAATKAPDQAWELVEHLLSSESLLTWIKGLGQLGSRKSVPLYAGDPVYSVFEQHTRYGITTPPITAWDEFTQIVNSGLASALRGESAVRPALDDIVRQVDVLLAR